MKIENIDIKKLEVDKYNARHGEWIEDEELIDSIRKQGVILPLVIRKSKKGYSIICGSRRWNASRKAGLKEVPCIIRDLSDMDTLALSLQENLQRGNLDSVQTSECIADLWEMMNGGKSYDEKIKDINKRFGLSETRIHDLLAISRLSDKIKGLLRHEEVDQQTAAGIATSDWKEEDKEEAAEILSNIDSGEKRRKILSEMKKYDDELTPTEAYQKVKKIEKINWYRWKPSYLKLNKAMDKACQTWDTDYNGVIDKCVTSEFKRKKWL
ncbi:hypothetical protein LCGC14_0570040 [marine sediment metagenome]|uniref:ParB-like N-terminal domain-containing protein n=1 Tax=marine sediment metagenome TaxID=412755 RepID=A0A0F9S365_9ZZZZ